MITEDYVSFETAKLLKEKGFDKDVLITDWWYDAEGQMYKRGNYSYSGAPFYDKETCFNCPTLQMAMKWLREVHNYHICPCLDSYVEPFNNEYYIVIRRNKDNFEEISPGEQLYFKTYEEAAEIAIKYCLENLI